VNMGIKLYNKVPDHIKQLEKNKLLRESRDTFCYNMHFIQWMNLLHVYCLSI
jgi:hypothetical protein